MSGTAPRVLVVDDEPQIVRGLKIILRSAGYAVEASESKAEALAALATRPPDALVLDLVLPDGQGVEICQEVRRWSGLPILVLSAIGDERERGSAADHGDPVRPLELRRRRSRLPWIYLLYHRPSEDFR